MPTVVTNRRESSIRKMSQFGHVSAVNLSRQCNISTVLSTQCIISNGLSFSVSDAMGHKLRIPTTRAFATRTNKNALPLKVC